jgi:DNA-binding transcriptional regulator YdaS (Cro superfamily)
MERQEFNDLLSIAGMTKKEFAELVGMEYGTINSWGSSGKIIPAWVCPFLECQSKSKVFEIIADKVDAVRKLS